MQSENTGRNVIVKELGNNLRRENTANSELKVEELKEKLEELETRIGNGKQIEAKNLQERNNQLNKIQETVKQIESNLTSSQPQVMEEAKERTTIYVDASKVKEKVN